MSAPRKYPWEQWFARKRLRLVKGQQYDCQPHSMAQQVRNAAYDYGVRVSIQIIGDVVLVTIGD